MMKIGQPADIAISNTAPIAPASGKTASAQSAAVHTEANRPAGVAVTVSTLARSIEEVAAKTEAADVDTDKVNAVRSAIEKGTFVVNAEAIADKLLSNAQEMLNRSRN